MNHLIHIHGTEIPVVEVQGVRVVTCNAICALRDAIKSESLEGGAA
ncbi:hypothetical protein RAS12_12015 [Achromobacter seleniivolatilans]|uniref:Uncharacterized protein n=1 Tax=Achromobacter seleniivolatilans TaxID=3047478 RepID=A0ABY9M7U1_9BURK|nr:hypothetical protein [Achromobacter sp. R39]WMD23063.1 hypothetical protein RAS12_12015 [Achromobacter sp. R39]